MRALLAALVIAMPAAFAEGHPDQCKNSGFSIEIDESNGTADVTISDSQGHQIAEDTATISSEYVSVPGQLPKEIKTWAGKSVKVIGTFTPALPSRNFSASATWPGQNSAVMFGCVY